jgi:hypothetical protein
MLIVDIVGAAGIVVLFCIPAVLVYRREFEDAYALWTTGADDDKDSETVVETAPDNEVTVFFDEETEISPTENGPFSSDRLTSDEPHSYEGALEVIEEKSYIDMHAVADETYADSCQHQERAEVNSENDHIVQAAMVEPVETQDFISTEAQAPEPIVATPLKHDALDDGPISFEATPAPISLHEELPQEGKKPIQAEDVLSYVASLIGDILPDSVSAPTEFGILHPTPVAEVSPPSAATHIPTQQEMAEQAIKTLYGISDELRNSMQGFVGHIIASSHGYAEHGDKICQLITFAGQSLSGLFPNDMTAHQSREFHWTQLVSEFWDEVQPRAEMASIQPADEFEIVSN